MFKLFSFATLFLGKLLRGINYFKKKQSLKVLTRLSRRCQVWCKERRAKHLKTVTKFGDIFLKKYFFRNLISTINEKVIFIQRTLRTAVKDRMELIDYVIQLWNNEEQNMFNQIILKEASSRGNNNFLITGVKSLNVFNLVPYQLKVKKINKQIKVLVAGYVNDMKEYKASLIMKKSISRFKNSFSYFQTRKPVSPNLRQEFTQEVMHQMISSSQKYRRTSTFTTGSFS